MARRTTQVIDRICLQDGSVLTILEMSEVCDDVTHAVNEMNRFITEAEQHNSNILFVIDGKRMAFESFDEFYAFVQGYELAAPSPEMETAPEELGDVVKHLQETLGRLKDELVSTAEAVSKERLELAARLSYERSAREKSDEKVKDLLEALSLAKHTKEKALDRADRLAERLELATRRTLAEKTRELNKS